MFLKTHIDLGTIKVGSKNTIFFEYENIARIINIASPCDCANTGKDPNKNAIKIVYEAKPVPKHLDDMGYTVYTIRKQIDVTHSAPDGIGEVVTHLVFTAEVKR